MFNRIILSTVLTLTTTLALQVNAQTSAKKATAAAPPAQAKGQPATGAVKSNAIIVSFKPADGKTEFFAVGKPSMIKINGEGEGPSGSANIEGQTVDADFKVDVTKLTTKIEMRDDHMKNKYLEVGKYPTSELKIKGMKLPKDFSQLNDSETEVPFEGDFTLHGKTSKVKGTAKIKKTGKTVTGEAEFVAKVLDYLDTLPTWTVVKVAEDVRVKVTFKGQF